MQHKPPAPAPEDRQDAKILPPFAWLRAFEAVFRLGGIRKAATSLDLDHAVVSRHVKSLEDWLGESIVARSGNRLQLTPAGQKFHKTVSAAIFDLVAGVRELVEDDAARTVRLWCAGGFGTQWLSAALADFERLRPDFSVEMRPTDEPANLWLHEADLDVRYYGDTWPPEPGGRGLRVIELARPLILAVASPEFAARMKSARGVDDFLSAPLLHEEHHQQWRAWLSHNGARVPDHLPGTLFWHAHLSLAAARAGRGIMLGSGYVVDDDLAAGTLVEVEVPGCQPVVLGAYALVCREDRWSLPAIAALRRHLRERASRHKDGAS